MNSFLDVLAVAWGKASSLVADSTSGAQKAVELPRGIDLGTQSPILHCNGA